jgi:hypothetical protein
MGLFDVFNKEARAKNARQKNIARALAKYAQSPDRFAAMEKLREDGSEEALVGLMKRFSFKYDKTIEDEQEKQWVQEVMVAKGEAAIPAVVRHAKEADSWSWPLRILEHIVTGDRLLALLDPLLAREEPTYTRDPSRKLEALSFLAEWRGAPDREVVKRIVPYLADFDEGVRYAALEALSHHLKDAPVDDFATELLTALVRPEEESRRIKRRAAALAEAAKVPLGERKDQVAAILAAVLPEYAINDKSQTLVKKGT